MCHQCLGLLAWKGGDLAIVGLDPITGLFDKMHFYVFNNLKTIFSVIRFYTNENLSILLLKGVTQVLDNAVTDKLRQLPEEEGLECLLDFTSCTSLRSEPFAPRCLVWTLSLLAWIIQRASG